ncbi:MAG: hypothetical protein RI907_261 [Pseudomonadota bacterium]|jgi:hypothetical protein
MRAFVLFLALVSLAGWWLLVGGRTINRDQVRAYYRDYEMATLARQPDALCNMLDDRFKSSGSIAFGEFSVPNSPEQDKAATCTGLKDLYETWEDLGDKMGGILTLESRHVINEITISPDGRSAEVDIVTSLDVGGTIMRLRSHTVDTLVRRNGVVKMIRSEGEGRMLPP